MFSILSRFMKAQIFIFLLMYSGLVLGQKLFDLRFHYESIQSGPYLYLQEGDSLKLDLDHKIGSMDLFLISYRNEGRLLADKSLIGEGLSESTTRTVYPQLSGCYQLRVVPETPIGYFHGRLSVSLFSSNQNSGRTCTINFDSAYLAGGKERFVPIERLDKLDKRRSIAERKKEVHSNGTEMGIIRFSLKKGEIARIELAVADENPRLNLSVLRDEDPFQTLIFRTFQEHQTIGFEALSSGRYEVQYWGRGVFKRMDEVAVEIGR